IRGFHVTGVQTCALPIWTVTPPEKQCPLFTDAADGMTVAEQEEVSASDPRCHQVWTSGQIVWTIPDEGNHVVVDDGSVVEALGRSEGRRVGDGWSWRGSP